MSDELPEEIVQYAEEDPEGYEDAVSATFEEIRSRLQENRVDVDS